MSVTVRYWAAAREAAGQAEELFDAPDLATLLAEIRSKHDPGRLTTVLLRCSYLVDEVSPGTRPHVEVMLAEDSIVDVLPPFAGGSQ